MQSNYNVINEWVAHSVNREKRIKGFLFEFHLRRYVKAMLCMVFLYRLIAYFAIYKIKFNKVIYRPNKKNVRFYKSLPIDETIVICKKNEVLYYNKIGFKSIPLEPLFFFLNVLCVFGAYRLIKRLGESNVYLNSDYGVDELMLLKSTQLYGGRSICVQHGLFPKKNNLDLDGMLCDANVVASSAQSDLLKKSGYSGDVFISDLLFDIREDPDINLWVQKGCPLIFVGPGYLTDNNLKQGFIEFLIKFRGIFKDHNVIYRPHPRELKHIPDKVRQLFLVDASVNTSLDNKGNLIYFGIKSTLLLEAFNSGRLSYVIRDDLFPEYFADKVLPEVTSINELHFLVDNEIKKQNRRVC